MANRSHAGRSGWFWFCCSLLVSLAFDSTHAVPDGFIDEGVVDLTAITGSFTTNPRKNNQPMLLLSSKEGLIHALEDPDNSDRSIQIGDLRNKLCTNGERGLQTILPHPNFASNRFLFVYYTASADGCKEDAKDGPSNRLSRFTVDSSSLLIDVGSERVLLETPPAPKRMHNGGAMAFGNDGLLYVLTGDAGSREPRYSQDMRNLYGKVLRLDVNGNDIVIPNGNPFRDGVSCAKTKGRPPSNAPSGAVCAEIFARGLRNPFRLAMNVNIKDKVRFVIGDVGASTWEEMSLGGTDFSGTNYAWPDYEGPCENGSTTKCAPPGKGVTDPFYYYEHTRSAEGGAVVGGAFVPAGLWPSKYEYLFLDYVFGKMFYLVEDKGRECRTCTPPRPGFRNETFHSHKDMVDMFFGPYKDGRALYVVSRADGQNVRRIRYTGSSNRAPVAVIEPSDTTISVGERITLDGSKSADPDGDSIVLEWDFGDGSKSNERKPTKSYAKSGEYQVRLTVTDSKKQTNQVTASIVVGTPPKASITSPAADTKFAVGQVLRLKGEGTDSNGKALDKTQLFWEVRQHHANHFHPFLDRVAGNDFDLQPAPEPEDFIAATNSFLEIIMYAVDSNGVTTTVSRKIQPKKVLLDVTSVPAGLTVFLDEFPVTTPATITSWENHSLRLNVNDQGSNIFTTWSTGGSRKSVFKVPSAGSSNLKLTAVFRGGSPIPPVRTPIRFVPPIPMANPTPLVPMAKPVSKLALNRNVRTCTSNRPCKRCEGNCKADDDCEGNLICFRKDAGKPGMDSVPGCSGSDLSRTDWCILPSSSGDTPVSAQSGPTVAPKNSTPTKALAVIPLNDKIRSCSSNNPCKRCEGHCVNDDDCEGSLVCNRDGATTSVPGCLGVDFSRTDWCVAIVTPQSPVFAPVPVVTLPTTPKPVPTAPVKAVALNRKVRDCSTRDQCRQCEGNCATDDECQGDLICFKKGNGIAGKDSVPGCLGTDLSRTDWCTVKTTNSVPTTVSVPVGKPVTKPTRTKIPLKRTVRTCTPTRPCGPCEGNCAVDDDCEGSMICFRKDVGKPGVDSVPGCFGTDLSKTDWCTFAKEVRL